VQFMPAVVLPQLLLCGLFVARSDMAGWLEGISNALPLTYAVDSLDELGSSSSATSDMWVDLAVVFGAAVAALVAASATLRRKSG
jgi:ABC-2 type transport system permease protein